RVGLGPFVIGTRKVRPRITREFTPAERLGLFVQFYNLKLDDATHKTSTDTSYKIIQSGREVWRADQHHQNGEQLTIEQMIPLTGLAPGRYTLEVLTKDQTTNQTIQRTADFTIRPERAQPQARPSN